MRLITRLDDVLIDTPRAVEYLAQLLMSLKLKYLVAPKIITQFPAELNDKLQKLPGFAECFTPVCGDEKEYREIIKDLLSHYYYNLDPNGIL